MESITDDQLCNIIHESHSWREVAEKCRLKTITRSLQRRVDKLGVDASHFDVFFDGKHTKFNKFSKEQIESIVRDNTEWKDIMKALNYTSCNHVKQVQKKLQKLGIDYSHVDPTYELPLPHKIPWSMILVKDSPYNSMTCLKKRLKNELGWEHKCSECKNTVWNDQPIPIEIDHINGDHFDNRLENLRFLCPNCHAQTDTYAGKNTKRCKENKKTIEEASSEPSVEMASLLDQLDKDAISMKSIVKKKPTQPKEPKPSKYTCADCHKQLVKKATRCLDCYAKHKVTTRVVERPSLEQLEQDLQAMSMVKVGQKYGVSDNCIRKWIKHYNKTS